MARPTKSIIAIVLWVVLGCTRAQEGFTELENNLSELENRLVGNWEYVEIGAKGNTFIYADQFNEPGYNLLSSVGQRAEIKRRSISYTTDNLYQLRWTDRGTYQLGTDGDANWQPNFGYWYLDLENNLLIHNEGLYYRTVYTISFSGNTMTRVSSRVMSSSFDANNGRNWQKGEEVVFREVFRRVD